jgi:hypothetical protein
MVVELAGPRLACPRELGEVLHGDEGLRHQDVTRNDALVIALYVPQDPSPLRMERWFLRWHADSKV